MELQDRLELGTDNKEMLDKWDLDLIAPFVKYLKDNNLRYDKELLDNIINDSTVVILKQKYLFDRPRPGSVAKDMGLPYLLSRAAQRTLQRILVDTVGSPDSSHCTYQGSIETTLAVS